MNRLLIVGAGGYGRAVAEAAMESSVFVLAGFLDDHVSDVWGFPVLGRMHDLDSWQSNVDVVVVAVGNNSLRSVLQGNLMQKGYSLATVIHPKAIVSPTATIGAGSSVMAGAVVGTNTKIGQGVIVNSGAIIDHDCIIDDYSHLGVRVAIGGGAQLGIASWMQAGSVIGSGMKLPSNQIMVAGEILKME